MNLGVSLLNIIYLWILAAGTVTWDIHVLSINVYLFRSQWNCLPVRCRQIDIQRRRFRWDSGWWVVPPRIAETCHNLPNTAMI